MSVTKDNSALKLRIDGAAVEASSPPKYREKKVYSPVTDLTLNLGAVLSSISQKKDESGTPKRRVCKPGLTRRQSSLAIRNSQPKPSQQISDEGCFVDSPSPVEREESQSFQKRQQSAKARKSTALKRFQGLPGPFTDIYADDSPQTRLGDLSVDGHDEGLPRRISSPISIDTPRTGRLFSPDSLDSSGHSSSLTSSLSSPLLSTSSKQKSSLGSSINDDEENSQDSGVGMSEKVESLCKDDMCEFKCPTAPAPKCVLSSMIESTNSPIKYSPCEKKSMPLGFSKGLFANSPIKLKHSSLTSSQSDDDTDDGFLEIKELDKSLEHEMYDSDGNKENDKPKGLDKLISGPMLSGSSSKSCDPHSVDSNDITASFFRSRTLADVTNHSDSGSNFRRGLFRSPSALSLNSAHRMLSKRTEPGFDDDIIHRVSKRRKSVVEDKENILSHNKALECSPMLTAKPTTSTLVSSKSCDGYSINSSNVNDSSRQRPKLHRCQSDTEAIIKAALERVDQHHRQHDKHLIGDTSSEYILPTIEGRHQDLKSITPSTMAALLRGEYRQKIANFVVIDCRYPYEYDGGHIPGALNIYTKDDLYNEFLRDPTRLSHTTEDNRRNILIFHCEFSSERAPRLSRFLRCQDREINKDFYPKLYYPEVYLLDQGYKQFFTEQKMLCEPINYTRMLDEQYCEDLRRFRAKSKSWSGDRKLCKGSRLTYPRRF